MSNYIGNKFGQQDVDKLVCQTVLVQRGVSCDWMRPQTCHSNLPSPAWALLSKPKRMRTDPHCSHEHASAFRR